MANSLRNKIKHLCYKGELSERKRDRLLNALDDADRINSELNRVKTELDYISRDDAIELIAGADETDGNEPVFSGKQVIKMLKGLPPVTPKAKWIPCSERLPEDRMYCLITVEITPYGCSPSYEVQTSWFDGRNFIYETYIDDHIVAKRGVVAWQPLPEAYKAESEDN